MHAVTLLSLPGSRGPGKKAGVKTLVHCGLDPLKQSAPLSSEGFRRGLTAPMPKTRDWRCPDIVHPR